MHPSKSQMPKTNKYHKKMKKIILKIAILAIVAAAAPYIAAQSRVQSAGDDGTYFNVPENDCSEVDNDGFIRRWLILDPINKPNRSNTVFTDTYLHNEFYKEYFSDQFSILPKDGEKVRLLIVEPEPDFGNDYRQTPPQKTEKQKKQQKKPKNVMLQWHDLESTGYNVQLYRFATTHKKQVYGVIFWVVTVIDCEQDIQDVRLSVGSNSASMWWLDGKEVLMLSGDRRMVRDDAMSDRLTLKKGRNVLRGAIINGPGMSNFCVRFIHSNNTPVTNINICKP